MKAVLLIGYGGVDQLTYGDVPDPKPADDEVLIKVIGTSLNPVDWKIREGYMKEIMPLELPAILGRDVAGEVVSVGSNVQLFKAGDKVLGFVNHSYAELLTAKSEELAVIPEGLNMEQAAVLPLVTLTGTQLIEKGVRPKAGQTILVTGAVGAVGRTAVYIAKAHGAVVIAGVRSGQRGEAVSLGADRTIALDNDGEIASVEELDAIADTVGGDVVAKLLPRLKKSGVLASVVGKAEAAEKAGIQVVQVLAQPDSKRLAELAEDVRDADLVIPIGKRFKLSEIREAHQVAQKGSAGKVLLTP